MFFGSHTKSYALDYLIDAVKQLPEEKLAVVFIGDGIYKKELKKRTEGMENVFHFCHRFLNRAFHRCLNI